MAKRRTLEEIKSSNFVSSTEIKDYLADSLIPGKFFYVFMKRDDFAQPVIGKNGGKRIYVREHVDAFINKIVTGELVIAEMLGVSSISALIAKGDA